MLASNGESGPPCGTPQGVASIFPLMLTPARRYFQSVPARVYHPPILIPGSSASHDQHYRRISIDQYQQHNHSLVLSLPARTLQPDVQNG